MIDINKETDDFFNSLPKGDEEEKPWFEENNSQKPQETAPVADNANVIEQQDNENTDTDTRKKPTRSERREYKQTAWLTEQLQKEREERIRLEERMNALANKSSVPVDPDIKRLLTETKDPEEASRIFNDLLDKVRSESTKIAEERFQELSRKEQQEVDKQASEINSQIEDIEDRYNVNLAGGSKLRSQFIDFVEKLSSKESDALPDMDYAWQVFSSLQKPAPQNAEQKQQASNRSMSRSVGNPNTNATPEKVRRMSFDSLRDIWDKINK